MERNSNIFHLVWAKMPLPDEELNLIEESHRIRPYLLFMENEDYYYSFPCTSKIFNKEIRYENSIVRLNRIIDDRKSLVLLNTVYKMPKKNLIQFAGCVPLSLENEIIKKIQANTEYCDYPEDVVNYFNSFDINYGPNDMVSVNNRLYIISSIIDDNYLCIPVHKYPVKNTYQFEVDAILYYADTVNKVLLNKGNITSYYTRTTINFNNIEEYSSLFPKIEDNIDYSKAHNLIPGMILKYNVGEEVYKMIVLTNADSGLEVLVGKEKQTYGSFIYDTIPSDSDFDYEIVGTLNSKRLQKLLIKHKNVSIIKKK